MVDASASGAGGRKVVEVRVFSQAPFFKSIRQIDGRIHKSLIFSAYKFDLLSSTSGVIAHVRFFARS